MPVNRFEATIHVQAPPEEVFAYLADFERHTEWSGQEEFGLERIEVVTPPPTRVGTRFRSVGRNVFRKPNVDESEVTAFDPPRSLEFTTVLRLGPAVVRLNHRYTLEPSGEGCAVSHTLFDPTPLTMGGRVLLFIMRTVASKQLIKQTLEGLQQFKAAAERAQREGRLSRPADADSSSSAAAPDRR